MQVPRFGGYTPQQQEQLAQIMPLPFLEGRLFNRFKPLNYDEIALFNSKRTDDNEYFFELLKFPKKITEDSFDQTAKIALDDATRCLNGAVDRMEQINQATTITQLVNFLGNLPDYIPSEATFNSTKLALGTLKDKLGL